MLEIRIRDVTDENIDDLCRICVPSEKRNDPTFVTGMEGKRKWAMKMLQKWGSFAKLAYDGSDPVGLIQYESVPMEGVVYIHCIYVPEKERWQHGIATQLLSSLTKEIKTPRFWFDDEPALALVTKTFPGEKPGQYPARLFFTRMGFRQVGEDPDHLYYPLKEGFVCQPFEERAEEYVPQEEDKGKALIIHSPSFCPFSYVFLEKAAQAIEEVAPGIPIRWIDKSEEPEEVMKLVFHPARAHRERLLVLDAQGHRRHRVCFELWQAEVERLACPLRWATGCVRKACRRNPS